MPRLAIYLLGPLAVTRDERPVSAFESDKVRALLAYLAAEPDRPHRREALAGLFWPDRPDSVARANLRHNLANLRQAIGDCEVDRPCLDVSRQTIQLCSPHIWCDAIIFSRLLERQAPRQQTLPQLEEAVLLYDGPFLDGFSLGDSLPFTEWLLIKRERYQHLLLSALHRLASHYETVGDRESALLYARRQIEFEPWREEAHRQMMRLLAANGQRGAALAQFATCRQALADTFSVAPSQETDRLYQAIRDGR
jgi:DNA-binding SARP family transcriptional activator